MAHRRLITTALGCLVCVPAALAAVAPDPRLQLDVSAGGRQVRATAGSYCLRDPGARRTRCTQAAYPLPTHGVLAVRARQVLQLAFGAAPNVVTVRLYGRARRPHRVLASLGATRQRGHPERFAVHLPRRLPCAHILDVSVSYRAREHANFWAALAPQHCRT